MTKSRKRKSASRVVETQDTDVEVVRVRILPNGKLDRNNAAKYLGRQPKTLACWASEGVGPPFRRVHGRAIYDKDDLDRLMNG